MVSSKLHDSPISDVRLSSVVPARVTGDDRDRDLTGVDLAMKLHYVKGLYFFRREAIDGLSISDLKRPMFALLDLYYSAAGRIRRRSTEEQGAAAVGRPFIKCNDGGVRIAEAECGGTLDEWLATEDGGSSNDQLFYGQALGPDLGFSPLVFIKFTWFKCGGFSIGLNWAHVLGDAFSASAFINMWAQILAGGQDPPKSLKTPIITDEKTNFSPTFPEKPFSLKKVDPVGDLWFTAANNCKMETHSFYVTAKQVTNILSKSGGLNQAPKVAPFEILCALVWKSLAKVRKESELRIVTVCSGDYCGRELEHPSNGQAISTVEAGFTVASADLLELAKLIAEEKVDERQMIEDLVKGGENEQSDFIVYGANLTFVNLERANVYGLKLNAQKPLYVNYSIGGIGEEGVVLVLPGPENGEEDGITLTVTLQENQMLGLRSELRKEWGLL